MLENAVIKPITGTFVNMLISDTGIVNAGLKAIWNFTNTPLALPPDIVQQRVNMAGDLAELSVKLSGKLW